VLGKRVSGTSKSNGFLTKVANVLDLLYGRIAFEVQSSFEIRILGEKNGNYSSVEVTVINRSMPY